jgi:hypothetical protein
MSLVTDRMQSALVSLREIDRQMKKTISEVTVGSGVDVRQIQMQAEQRRQAVQEAEREARKNLMPGNVDLRA